MKSGILVVMVVALLSCAFGESPPFDPMRPNYDNIPQCLQPPESGLCLAYIVSYYYNPSTKSCQTFVYGGCRGNLNRFISEEQCMSTCAGKEDIPRTKPVVELVPNPEAIENEANTDVCSQPQRPGLCYAYFNRFYFNGVKCESFVYGGCDGNQNNFETEEACNKACPPKVVENQPKVEEIPEVVLVNVPEPEANVDVCSQPQQSGLCYAHFNRFYFNGEKCEAFVYGGCGGNQNNFETEEACNKACPSKVVKNFFPFRQGKGGKTTIKTA